MIEMGIIILLMISSPFIFYGLLTICECKINEKYNCTNKGTVKML